MARKKPEERRKPPEDINLKKLAEFHSQLRRPDGITRRAAKTQFGWKNNETFSRWLSKVKDAFKVIVERDDSAGTGDDATWRAKDAGPVNIEVPADAAAILVMLCREFAPVALRPASLEVERFAKGLEAKLPEQVQATLKTLKGRVQLMVRATWQGDPVVFSTLIDAIASSRCVDLDYRSVRAELSALAASPAPSPVFAVGGKARKKTGGVTGPATRRCEVHGIYFAKRSLYAVVRELGKGTAGTADGLWPARFDRIKLVKPTDVPFTPIPNFSVEKFMAPAWEAFRSNPPKPITVTIRVDPEIHVNIKSTKWHRSQKGPIEEVHKGTKTGKWLYSFTVDGFSEISYWVASLGAGVEAVRPKEFREHMRTLIEGMRARYEP